MITDAQHAQFKEQGYCVYEDLFTAQEMDDLQSLIDPFVEAHESQLMEVGKEGISRANEISFTSHLADKSEGIRDFIMQERWAKITAELLGPDVSLYWDQSVYKNPEGKREFPWHQDSGYIVVDPLVYLTCWLAMEDATLENGCIWVVPGSHRQGLVEHRQTPIGLQCYEGDENAIPVELRKGSVALFSSLLFHRSGPNFSKGTRKGYVIQYAQSHTRFEKTGELVGRIPITKAGQPIAG
jgi:ectoine hydroxylase-related dioxygenase (phytanoyl-CoA dioxygenase family)